jgi:hypothetical protein
MKLARAGVVRLRQPPQVVIAEERASVVARTDSHLQVQRLARLVPHLVEPMLAEL